jgi:hypothetical protein
MAYQIVVHELAIEELESIRAFDQRRILAAPRSASSSRINLAYPRDGASASST